MDWVFPPDCGGCGVSGYQFCPACQNQLVPLGENICPVCGEPDSLKDCKRCRENHLFFDQARSTAVYTTVLREAIHHFKFNQQRSLARQFALLMRDSLRQLPWQFDFILPVPMHVSKLKQRGYNQVTLMARELGWMMKKPVFEDVLHRTVDTQSQFELKGRERWQNVADVFSADAALVNNKTILLLDDIMTTGATLNACAKALKSAGSGNIYVFTLARAILA